MKTALLLILAIGPLTGCQSLNQEEENRKYEERQAEQARLKEDSSTAAGLAGLLNEIFKR
jgi:hypothetical protein